MPVYNAVNYVDAAIKSIIEQEYMSYELILIDDGSTDGSDKICLKYAKSNSNIIYIRQDNKGICGARNVGIRSARGTYIGFADHDDLYNKNYLNFMSKKIMEENEPELVRCGVMFVESLPNGRTIKRTERMPLCVWTAQDMAENLIYLPSSHFTVWNCLYNRKFLLDNSIFFPEEMKHGQEDYYFNLCIMQCLKKEFFVDEILYTHFRRVGQSTSASFYSDVIDCMAMNFEKEINILDQYIDDDEKKVAYRWIGYARKIWCVYMFLVWYEVYFL